MKNLILGILAILAGAGLIYLSLARRPKRYILLSGHKDGRLWSRKIPA